ncbi:MAG: hypothetical protein WC479_10475 [Candidatus Izemoplasmatales bacterium]
MNSTQYRDGIIDFRDIVRANGNSSQHHLRAMTLNERILLATIIILVILGFAFLIAKELHLI